MAAAAPDQVIVAEVEALLAAGLVFQAFERASAGLELFTQNVSLRVLRALALARTGAVTEAVTQLTPWLDGWSRPSAAPTRSGSSVSTRKPGARRVRR